MSATIAAANLKVGDMVFSRRTNDFRPIVRKRLCSKGNYMVMVDEALIAKDGTAMLTPYIMAAEDQIQIAAT
jgi:hypothetical protein